METNVIYLFQKLSVNEKKSFLSKISLNPMKGSVAFITGGNRGIGKKIVHKFASKAQTSFSIAVKIAKKPDSLQQNSENIRCRCTLLAL